MARARNILARSLLLALALASSALQPPRRAARRAAALGAEASFRVRRPRRSAAAELPSPIALPEGAVFVDDDDIVLASAVARVSTGVRSPVAYARAGPRAAVARTGEKVVAAVVTCGGLCPGLNTVTQELYRCLTSQYGVGTVLGAVGGYAGVAAGRWRPLDDATCDALYARGGTLLETSRGKQDAGVMADSLEAAGVDALFVVGGDGTIRGASYLCDELDRRNSKISVAAIPKTIDNDIPLIDRSFGFDTAVAEAKRAIDVAVVEARSFPRGLGVVRLMGRDAGFLAVHAALAAPGDVDACLVPEKGFAVDGLFEYVGERLDAKGHAILVVAEGVDARVTDAAGNPVDVDGDIGPWLCAAARAHFDGSPGREAVSLKYVDPSYTVRSQASVPADTIFCSRLAAHACHGAMAGYTAFAVGTVNSHFAEIPLADFENRAAITSVTGRLFQDLVRSTGQPQFTQAADYACDDDLESPSGGCVVTWAGESTTGVQPV